jgi:hypothetical protein
MIVFALYLYLYYISAGITFILQDFTHSKNTSKSGDAVFYMAGKCLIFPTFKFLKKFHETPKPFIKSSNFMKHHGYS